jgi:AcrR family transcriptional regulator
MTNREALLESALASLQARGYADATARDIAGGAGVSLGAIGYHFGSKDQLLDAALAEGVRRWFAPLIGLLDQSQQQLTLEQLGPALDGFLETLTSNRPLVIAYFEALLRAERSPALRIALAADFHALRTALTSGIEHGLRHQPDAASPDPQAAASLIMATFDGLIIQWLLDPEQIQTGPQIAQTLERAARFVAAGAAAPAPRPLR